MLIKLVANHNERQCSLHIKFPQSLCKEISRPHHGHIFGPIYRPKIYKCWIEGTGTRMGTMLLQDSPNCTVGMWNGMLHSALSADSNLEWAKKHFEWTKKKLEWTKNRWARLIGKDAPFASVYLALGVVNFYMGNNIPHVNQQNA